ncbi:Hydroxymethylpyrimidine ABC transporter, substrate-binding component [Pediococcus damnosus]|uniref:Hydroxymethylpyrimidine ABC transporter, substrate-binding component n=1 Tax=Pediococcus damnosus TaxID=51663 RepID=A0ABM6A2W9_9LACO|nr:ABC transporter substrate-binding protein [Pediococcus damnosus]AMV60845.1 Hydroxymethylpyrimidine ABC transporter, substrate-binding component [Pediococcus damnosus]AMV65155.1 Hydroxymethylpyrimidine ABC transporter, substrate-binding component [Pediococcus damnosus]AMV66660.1 Hydroxymethylpyrimidine ABC transporter, substrate-binding component [Pediococcus damnosus]KJU74462.1 nitrate ABC transporter substrate-binding protein [Pediococcus damnosus LMG 28219]PIO84797.1 nitrate ABC transport
MRTITHKWLILLFSLSLIVMLSGCQSKQSKSKNRTVTVVLDWTPNTNHTGMYVAKQKGYYKKYHLNVKFMQPPKDGAEQLVASGKAEFGVSAQDTFAGAIARKDPLPITTIAGIIQHNTSGIMSRKADGITSPKKMMGKRYSTWDLPIEQATIKQVVNDDHGNYKKLKLIPNNITDEVAALKSKQTDDIWVFYGWAGQNAKVKNFPINYFSFRSLNKVFDYYTPTLIGNNSFLKNNPQVAKDFMKATTKGYDYASNHPHQSADILMDQVPELKSNRKLVYASQTYLSKQYALGSKQWGKISATRWNGFYTWLNKNNLVSVKLKKDQGFTNKYLPK